jgi:hypothetical protein
LYGQEWVVYAKAPFAGPQVVLKYLARYTHRVALSNQRLRTLVDGRVTFSHRDYRHGGRERELTLEADEFLRRYLQHVLPRGFVKVRHYGLLRTRGRNERLQQCREQLARLGLRAKVSVAAAPSAVSRDCCPLCGGVLVVVAELPRPGHPTAARPAPAADTS